MDKIIKILLLDGQHPVNQILKMQIEMQGDMTVIGEIGMGSFSVKRVEQLNPDIVMIDLDSSGIMGIANVSHIKSVLPNISIIFLTMHDDDAIRSILATIEIGTLVFKGPDPANLLAAIRQVQNHTI